MRKTAALILGALFCACAGEEPAPVLSVTPSGPVTAAGPVSFSADPVTIADKVSWSLSGPGTLSDNTGRTVIYRPPAQVDATQTATLTATANGQTVSVQIHPAPAQVPAGPISGLHGPVQVIYDAQRVPHVFCGNQLDCYAAQGYLQAQDRLFQMDFYRRVARGQLASLVGPLEVDQDKQLLTLFTTRDGKRIEDVLVASLDADTKAKLDAYSSGVNAYLDFLKQHVTLMPGEYAQISAGLSPNDIPGWSPADSLAVGRLQQFQLSETIEKETGYGQFALVYAQGPLADPGKINTYIRAKQPIDGFTLSADDSAVPASAPPPSNLGVAPSPELINALGQVNEQMRSLRPVFGTMRDGVGSNNWVVAGDHSANGHAMVANDPHLSLEYPPLFHLMAMTASDGSGLNVTGGSFPGVPGALIGRGAHVGWGVTVVGYDVTDVYQEKWLPAGASCPSPAGCVLFNGVQVPIMPYQFPIHVRGSADVTATVLVVPHHGPIIHYDPPTAVLSFRWTGHEVTRDLKAFLDLNNASAVGDANTAGTAFAALKNYAVGAQNFVLADDQGHIGYDPHALVPVRGWFGTAPSALPWLPLPGTGIAEWGSGNAADNCAGTGANAPAIPGPCWVPDAILPQGKDPAKGYFATANSDPAGYTATNNPVANPVTPGLYLSFDWSDPTDMRYARIARVLKDKTSSAAKMSVADMQALQTDHQMLLARMFMPAFPDPSAVPAAQQATYRAGLQLLQAWTQDGNDCPTGLTTSDPNSAPVTDATQLRDSAGCLLFHSYLGTLLRNVFDDDMAVVAAKTGSFHGDGGAEIRGMLYMLDPATQSGDTSFCNDVDQSGNVTASHTCTEQVVKALFTAVATLGRAFGTDTSQWLWGRVHTLTTQTPLSPLVGSAFSAGPYARPGGAFTVDVATPSLSSSNPLDFSYRHGSNVRFIAEMTPDVNAAVTKMQLPGPEVDAPHGVFANDPDLLGQYVKNQYFDYLVGHQVDTKAVSSQGFTGP